MEEKLRNATRSELINSCSNIVDGYMRAYDAYHSTGSRDSAFLKDMGDLLICIESMFNSYQNDYAEPSYALEKLEHIKNVTESTIRYFEAKMDRKDN